MHLNVRSLEEGYMLRGLIPLVLVFVVCESNGVQVASVLAIRRLGLLLVLIDVQRYGLGS